MYGGLRPLGVGEILDNAIQLYRKNFRALLVMTAVVVVPLQVLSVLINLSTRGAVTAGAGNLVVGVVIGGATSRTLLIRGIGPALAQFGIGGVLADPLLQIYNANTGVLVAVNDNWAGDATVALVAGRVGAFALTDPASRDAALLVALAPGAYTANLSGGAGVGLVELYDVP